MKEDNGKIIAATQNGIFYYTISTGEITKLSKTNGLHNIGITAFDYNPQTKTGLIGYENGSMDVITPQEIKYIVDIPIATGYNGDKKINHISITGNQAVISVGYGVSIFNLQNKEFGDSAFFLSGGVYQASNEATIFGNKVYSVTDTGLKSHQMNTTFPVYSTRTTEARGAFKHIDSESELVYSAATAAYIYNNGTPTQLPTTFEKIRDVVITSNSIVVTDNRVYTYGINGVSQNAVSLGEECNTALTAGGKIFRRNGIIGELRMKVTILLNLPDLTSILLITSIFLITTSFWFPLVPEPITTTIRLFSHKNRDFIISMVQSGFILHFQ